MIRFKTRKEGAMLCRSNIEWHEFMKILSNDSDRECIEQTYQQALNLTGEDIPIIAFGSQKLTTYREYNIWSWMLTEGRLQGVDKSPYSNKAGAVIERDEAFTIEKRLELIKVAKEKKIDPMEDSYGNKYHSMSYQNENIDACIFCGSNVFHGCKHRCNSIPKGAKFTIDKHVTKIGHDMTIVNKETPEWKGVFYGDGKWNFINDNGILLQSTDRINWTKVPTKGTEMVDPDSEQKVFEPYRTFLNKPIISIPTGRPSRGGYLKYLHDRVYLNDKKAPAIPFGDSQHDLVAPKISEKEIEEAINDWKKQSPEEVDARLNGTWNLSRKEKRKAYRQQRISEMFLNKKEDRDV
jgi:hypothetical protein